MYKAIELESPQRHIRPKLWKLEREKVRFPGGIGQFNSIRIFLVLILLLINTLHLYK